ncbi:DUF397 domain-containing protein [Catenuloplanes sp. NPDC051500]|uniref:DUF397 domain-containing protein n=1 Tax=Catenuloplanes sp. NPDC051500 TaxID=3363959 RepID=UPI00379DB73A
MTLTDSRWIKASRCQMEQCVEVRALGLSGVGVRDSAQESRGPVLAFTSAGWSAFVGGLKADSLGDGRA